MTWFLYSLSVLFNWWCLAYLDSPCLLPAVFYRHTFHFSFSVLINGGGYWAHEGKDHSTREQKQYFDQRVGFTVHQNSFHRLCLGCNTSSSSDSFSSYFLFNHLVLRLRHRFCCSLSFEFLMSRLTRVTKMFITCICYLSHRSISIYFLRTRHLASFLPSTP